MYSPVSTVDTENPPPLPPKPSNRGSCTALKLYWVPVAVMLAVATYAALLGVVPSTLAAKDLAGHDIDCWVPRLFTNQTDLFWHKSGHKSAAEYATQPVPRLPNAMCERARGGSLGNLHKHHAALSRLRNGECLNLVVFGGSISCGHALKQDTTKYGDLLESVLNAEYPCSSQQPPNARGHHQVSNFCRAATASDYVFDLLSHKAVKQALSTAHLVMVDTGSNDVSELVKGPLHSDVYQTSKFNTEAIIRKLGEFYPDVALLWLEIGWRDWDVLGLNGMAVATATNTFHHTDAIEAHEPILRYYGVPSVNLLRMMEPVNTRAKFTFLGDFLFSDQYHLTVYGHAIVATNVLYFIREMAFTEPTVGWLAEDDPISELAPVIMTPDELIIATSEPLDVFSLGPSLQAKPDVLQRVDGWEFARDVAQKPMGWLTTKRGASFVIHVGHAFTGLTVNMLHSYDGLSALRIRVFGMGDNTLTELPNDTDNLVPLYDRKVDAIWPSHTSQQYTTRIQFGDGDGEATNLWVEFREESYGDDAPFKLKLFYVQTYA